MTADNGLEIYRTGTLELLQWSTEQGINNYLMSEDVQDIPMNPWGFYGIYPRLPIGQRPAFMTFSIDLRKDVNATRRKVLALQLPERVKRIRVQADSAAARTYDVLLADLYMPSKLLAICEVEDTREEAILLFCTLGVRPETALREIQQRTREAIAKGN